MSVAKVINIIDDLKERGFIRQDRVNARTTVWDSADAVYYTVKDKRDTIDICAVFRG
jgi:hypothetical protein